MLLRLYCTEYFTISAKCWCLGLFAVLAHSPTLETARSVPRESCMAHIACVCYEGAFVLLRGSAWYSCQAITTSCLQATFLSLLSTTRQVPLQGMNEREGCSVKYKRNQKNRQGSKRIYAHRGPAPFKQHFNLRDMQQAARNAPRHRRFQDPYSYIDSCNC